MPPPGLINYRKPYRLSIKMHIGHLCLFFFFFAAAATAGEKSVIGETAWIQVAQLPFSLLARIDTGARTTSIHAVDIRISGESSVVQENIGKTISFITANREGKSHPLTATIIQVSTIRNSQGTEQRYVIELPLSYKHKHKKVRVNLKDRSGMKYKLLIGRNWLSGDFLVDVDLEAKRNNKR